MGLECDNFLTKAYVIPLTFVFVCLYLVFKLWPWNLAQREVNVQNKK